jgi:hypothetical protein
MCSLLARLMQSPPPAVGFGAASPPREIFLVGFGGFAAKTNQKLGCGAQPHDFATAPRICSSLANALIEITHMIMTPYHDHVNKSVRDPVHRNSHGDTVDSRHMIRLEWHESDVG